MLALLMRCHMEFGSALAKVSRVLAVFAGILLYTASVITVLSIIGRSMIDFGLRSIKGDVELVQMCVGIAVFCFLPWCQLKRGHVTVGIMVDAMPVGVKAVLICIGDVILTVIATVIAWRICLGLLEKYGYEETTLILGVPVWYGYLLSSFGAVTFFATALHTSIDSIIAISSGRVPGQQAE